MAEVIKEAELEKKSLVIQQVVVQSPDRRPKDIADFIQALESAESVYAPQRVLLYDLYDRLELDGHFTGVWEKRINTVVNKKLQFIRNKKKVDLMDDLISSDPFREFLKLRMSKRSHGLFGAEFIPGAAFHFIEVPRKHIKPEKRVISKEQYADTGFTYDGAWNFIVMGSPKDKGFLLKCAVPILYKQGAFGDWAQFLEIFGLPARLFKYDVYDEKTKREAADLMKNAGSSLSMLIPKQLEFEMLDGKTSNSNGDLQDKFVNACDREISVVVLSNTETTTSSKSSGYAQAETHADQQDEIIMSDMQDVLNTLNDPKFLNILKSYGYPVEGGRFQYEQEVKVEDLIKKANLLTVASKLAPVGHDHVYETLGIPKPANYDALIQQQQEERTNRMNGKNGNDPNTPNKKAAKKQKKQLSSDTNWLQRFTDFFG